MPASLHDSPVNYAHDAVPVAFGLGEVGARAVRYVHVSAVPFLLWPKDETHAFLTVESRWAMIRIVRLRDRMILSKDSCTTASDSASRALVASSVRASGSNGEQQQRHSQPENERAQE